MRFTILIIDVNEIMSCINVYGGEEFTKEVLLEKLPYMERSEVFENAISLACRLRSSGFNVYVRRADYSRPDTEVDK